MNPYDVLGVPRDADLSSIKSAYKDLAKQHHPDKGGDPEKFKELSSAYEILGDEGKRRRYDMTGSVSDQPDNPFGNGSPFGNGTPFGDNGGFGVPDFISQMFGGGMFGGGGGGMGGQMGGGGGSMNRKKEGKAPGKTQEVPLRLADYYYGRNLTIKLGRQSFCKTCKGSGAATTKQCDPCNGTGVLRQVVMMGPMQMINQGPCGHCQGRGQQMSGQCGDCAGRGFNPEEKTLEIKIEPGMMSGNTVVFSGMCSDHPGYTEAGDVVVLLREADEEESLQKWKRENSRLLTSIVISLTEALLGTVRLLQGHPGFPSGVPVEIPAGVQNMWTVIVPGLGMPIRGTPKFGDVHITVAVMPTQDELATLRSQNILLKSMFTTLPEAPKTSETVRVASFA
jgi:DnaJ family protein A protein 2